ncbi:MAG: electron transport complex subunit RsxC [Paramuribaculum sp.]|nr:electron transport complex subunit RsxC [Paramuribaculum sp.]
MGRTFRIGGVHPPQHKDTAGRPIVRMALPRSVTLLVGQHIGAPAELIVAVGDAVVRGQLVAEAAGAVSAPVHTPISGKVTRIALVKNSAGMPAKAVVVEADEENHVADENGLQESPDDRDSAVTAEEIREIAGKCGVVGLGGATFPSRIKLSPPKDSAIDTIVINGAECEPYLTCDDALMREYSQEIVRGSEYMMRACGAERVLIGIEDNKPEAIAAMADACGSSGVQVAVLRTKYPQGGEKQLVQALTGRTIGSGCLPASVGVVVHNVATARALYRAVKFGEPVMERIITVAGDVARPGNYLVPVGTRISSVIDMAGGIREDEVKVILGGPMMGRVAENLDAPTVKGLSGIIVLSGAQARRHAPEPCIRCGECVNVCPMGLSPYLMSTLSRLGRTDDAAAHGIADCMECGCCSYVCPASRPILDFIRVGKQKLAADRKRKKK